MVRIKYKRIIIDFMCACGAGVKCCNHAIIAVIPMAFLAIGVLTSIVCGPPAQCCRTAHNHFFL